jgi:hypothetical protein
MTEPAPFMPPEPVADQPEPDPVVTQPVPPDVAEPEPEAVAAVVAEVPASSPLPFEQHAGGGTSNETALLPPVLPTAAAKAHAMISMAMEQGNAGGDPATLLAKVLAILAIAHAELDRFVPSSLRHAAGVEAGQVLSREL